jgi:ATP synthase protein I
MTIQNKEEDNKPKLSKYARYSSLVIQMGVLIAFFTWLGTFLDKKFHSKIAWWTIGLSLFGVFAGLYLVIKDVINSSNKEDEK